MEQYERRLYLINTLLAERGRSMPVPRDEAEQKRLLRALMNIRMPAPLSEEYLNIEGEYLKEEAKAKGIAALSELAPCGDGLYLRQGDITRLACDAIVNAANSGMTGCYQPLHNCIDNCIHSAAGLGLRNYCAELMRRQGYPEPTGEAKLTPAFNLPCKFVIHTVGPIVEGRLTELHVRQLASCYKSCLWTANENGLESIAFCCISTGVFGFPQREAARIAVSTVADYKAQTGSRIKVIFNVFKDEDLMLYRELLSEGE